MIQKKYFAGAILLLGMLVSLGAIYALSSQQSADDLFEAALLKKEAEGDLNGAIQLFQKIIKTFPQNREMGAKALLQIGICYEKMGKEEAQRAYQQIIKDYADQQKVVADARARLASLASGGPAGLTAGAETGLTFRKIDFKDAGASHQARLSPDGRRLLYIGFQEKEPQYSIRVLELATSKSHILVEGIDADAATLIFEWSPDGKKVVYRTGRGELRVIDSDGGRPDLLWACPEKEPYVYPLDWSGQNHALLIGIVDVSKNSSTISVLPEGRGEPRIVLSGSRDELNHVAQFSPDGKSIVGTKRIDKNIDVYAWALDGEREVRITDHPADDEYPLWSPDGDYIVYVSNRARTVDLWAVPMSGINPSGDPLRIQADIGKGKVPSDLTLSGQLLFYGISSAGNPSDLFVLPVDRETAEAQGSFHAFDRFPSQSGRWSPDGSRVAYTSRKGNIQLPDVIIRAGGEMDDLEIPAQGHWIGNVEWARDGKHLLFPGWNNDDGRVGIFRISLEEQSIEPVHELGDKYGARFQGAYVNLRWLPLAKMYMFSKLVNDEEQDVCVMDPTSYKIDLVTKGIRSSGYNIPSPDGRYVICIDYKNRDINLLNLKDISSTFLCKVSPEGWPAFSWSPDGLKFFWNEGRHLKIHTVANGMTEILIELDENKKTVGGLDGTPNTAWSPDGRKIACVVRDAAKDSEIPDELWIVDIKEKGFQKIAVAPSSHPRMSNPAWHASGEMIFVDGSSPSKRTGFDHWIMENFLPGRKDK